MEVASEIEARAGEEQRVPPASLYFTTLVGLLFAFGVILAPVPGLLRSAFEWAGMSADHAWELIEIIFKFAVAALIVGLVVYAERRSLSSLGLKTPSWSDLGLGLALLIAILTVEAVFTLAAQLLFPHAMSNVAVKQLRQMMGMPVGLWLLVALSAGVGEEIAERGFALSRLAELSGGVVFAAAATLVLAIGAHVPYWGWRYAILLVPAESLFIATYLWRRTIMPNIIAHTMLDALPVAIRIAGLAGIAVMGARGFHEGMAAFRFSQRDYKGAIAEYTLALEAKPHDPQLLRYRASVERYDRNFAAAIADLDEILARNPKDVDALMERSESYLGAGNYDRAQADADQAVALAPQDAGTYSTRAEVYYRRGKYDEAIADVSQAMKYTRKKDAELYYHRGFAYAQKRDYGHAIADLNEAERLEPGVLETIEERALVYQAMKQYPLALRDYTRAIKIDPTGYWPYYQRGNVHALRGEHQLALEDFKRAAALAPTDSASANAIAWLLSTCPDAKIRDGKVALKYANQACELTSWQDWQLIDTLAAAYAENGNFAEAAVWEQRAIDLMKSVTLEEQKQAREQLELYKQGKPYRELHSPG